MHMNTQDAITKLAMAVSILKLETFDNNLNFDYLSKGIEEKYASKISAHMEREDLTFSDLHLAIETLQMAISGFSKSYQKK